MTAPNVNKDSLICRSRKSSFKKYLFFVLFRAQTRELFSFQLMKSFSAMPMDQHLTLNGIKLTDDEATLISLGIRPGSLLLLKVCEDSIWL